VRLTVIGCGTAQPQPDTPASGLLVEAGETRLLLDAGQGVISRLQNHIDPRTLTAVIVGHLHADHYIDIVALRYLFPWGDRVPDRLPVFLPPGGQEHMTALAAAISERSTFFDDSFVVSDYVRGDTFTVGDLTVRLIPGLHYVPACGVQITDPAGRRLVYAGDTGPNEDLVRIARGADLFVCEATLGSPAEDDPRRGHVTGEEALAMATAARAGRALLVHYPSARRAALLEQAAAASIDARVALPDMQLDVGVERISRAARPRATRVQVA
jgi:ribonuclease BN (tRNA processing enzyme)